MSNNKNHLDNDTYKPFEIFGKKYIQEKKNLNNSKKPIYNNSSTSNKSTDYSFRKNKSSAISIQKQKLINNKPANNFNTNKILTTSNVFNKQTRTNIESKKKNKNGNITTSKANVKNPGFIQMPKPAHDFEITDNPVTINFFYADKKPRVERFLSYQDAYNHLDNIKCTPIMRDNIKIKLQEKIYEEKNKKYDSPVNPSYSTNNDANQVKNEIIGEAEDFNDFKNFYDKIVFTPKKYIHETESIYLGIDFGTSYTKIAYYKDKNNKAIIPFGSSYFKASVVYLLKDGSLSLFKEGECKQIRFFKATMMKSSDYDILNEYQQNNDTKDFEYLCSTFFLANIIRFSKEYLEEKYKAEIELIVSLGAPTKPFEDKEIIYKKVLHNALSLALERTEISDLRRMDIQELRDHSKLSEKTFDSSRFNPDSVNHCVMSELFVEVIYLLNTSRYPQGDYFVIDIGGGTADCVVIKKTILTTNEEKQFSSFGYSVLPFGNEIRKKTDNQDKYHGELGGGLSKTLYEYYSRYYKKSISKNNLDIKIILFGGAVIGENGKIFKSKIGSNPGEYFESLSRGTFVSPQYLKKDPFDENYFYEKDKLLKVDRQRLTIACQLANQKIRDAYLSYNELL